MRQTTNIEFPKIEPKTKVDARVSPKTKQRLVEIAAGKGKKHTALIRDILENYVKNYDL